MLAPVPATIPDSMLTPDDVLAKFSPRTLAGLGCGPSCGRGHYGMGDDGSDDSDLVNLLGTSFGTSGADALGTNWEAPPTNDLSTLFPSTSSVSLTPATTDLSSYSNLFPQGTTAQTSANGQVTVSTPSGSSLSSAQATQLLQGLINSGTTLAELGLVQPGTVLTAGGVSRQSTGATIQGTPLTGVLGIGSGSGLLIIGLLAVAGIFLVMESSKGK